MSSFVSRDIRILGVSVDSPDGALKMKKSAKVSFDLISDPKGQMMDIFGLRHSGAGPGGGDIARSASVLVNSEGDVLWAVVADNYRVRPNPLETLAAIDSLIAGQQ